MKYSFNYSSYSKKAGQQCILFYMKIVPNLNQKDTIHSQFALPSFLFHFNAFGIFFEIRANEYQLSDLNQYRDMWFEVLEFLLAQSLEAQRLKTDCDYAFSPDQSKPLLDPSPQLITYCVLPSSTKKLVTRFHSHVITSQSCDWLVQV